MYAAAVCPQQQAHKEQKTHILLVRFEHGAPRSTHKIIAIKLGSIA